MRKPRLLVLALIGTTELVAQPRAFDLDGNFGKMIRQNYKKCMRDEVFSGGLHKPFDREQYGASCYAQAGSALYERLTFPIGRECMALMYQLNRWQWPERTDPVVAQLKKEDTILDYASTSDFVRWMGEQTHFITRKSCNPQKLEQLNRDLKAIVGRVPFDAVKLRKRVEQTLKTFAWQKKGPAYEGMQPAVRRAHLWSEKKIPILDRGECHRRVQTVKHYVCLGIPVALGFKLSANYVIQSGKYTGTSQRDQARDTFHVALAFAATGKPANSNTSSFLLDETIQVGGVDAQKKMPPGTRQGLLPFKDGCRIGAVNVVLSEWDRKVVEFIEKTERLPARIESEGTLNWETRALPEIRPLKTPMLQKPRGH